MPDGLEVSVGGTWLGIGQDRMFRLSEEVGVGTYDQFSRGDHLLRLDDTNVRYIGSAVPKKYLLGLGSYAMAMRRLSRMADRLPVERPWDGDDAEELDARTLTDWLNSRLNVPSNLGRVLAHMTMRVLFCTNPAEVSVLGALVLARGGYGTNRGFEYYTDSKLTETHLLDGGPRPWPIASRPPSATRFTSASRCERSPTATVGSRCTPTTCSSRRSVLSWPLPRRWRLASPSSRVCRRRTITC
jgi:monoamine oxidase